MHYFDQLENSNQAYVKAVLFHLGMVLGMFAISQYMDFGKLDYKPIKNPEIITSAVRIDIVAMPKLTVQELKKLNITQTTPEQEAPKEESKSNETSKVEFKKVEKKIDVNNLLKNFSQKNIVKKTQKKEKEVDKSALRQIILEGNKVSQGSSATGESISQANQAYVAYVQSLPDKVRPNWKLPSYLKDNENLRCRIRIFLDPSGNIIKTQIVESSGDKEFDAKALQAVRLSSPLPKPSQEFMSKAIGGNITLGFPL